MHISQSFSLDKMDLLSYFNMLRLIFMKKIIFIFIILFFTSCSKDEHIERDKFIDIYAESLIISADTSVTDSIRKNRIDSLLKLNGYTEKDFKITAERLSQNPAEWRDTYKLIVEKIEMKKLR